MAHLVLSPVFISFFGSLWADYLDARNAAPDPVEATLAATIRSLSIDISKLSPVADFVTVSKKQREVSKLEKSLAAKKAEGKARAVNRLDWGRIVRWAVIPLLQFIILLMFLGRPVAFLPAGWFAWFRIGLDHSGGVLLFVWLLVVTVAVGGASVHVSRMLGLRANKLESQNGSLMTRLASFFM